MGLVAEAADVSNFDFHHNGTLKQHWKGVLQKKGGLMGFKNERISHWPYIIARMKENYNKMTAEQQEFVDWFLNFNFDKAKKEGLRRYYRQNFFSILKRKLHLK